MIAPGLVRWHRNVALTLGSLAALITLVGSTLVFRDELTAIVTPAVVVGSASPASGVYQRTLEAARTLEPAARRFEIIPSPHPDRAWEVDIHSPRGERDVYVDPHDGRVVADEAREALPFATLFRLHSRLLAGDAGKVFVALAGATLLFLAISGVVLWWPRSWKGALRIRLQGNRLAVSYDLHRCVGVTFAAILAVNAVIGVSMVYDVAASGLVNALAGSADRPPPPAVRPGLARPLDEIVAAAERAFPAGRVSRVLVQEGLAVRVRSLAPGDQQTQGMNRVDVDPATAKVLRVSPLATLAPGSRMFEWLYPLHTGRLIGWPYRALLVLAGLAPILQLVTGIIVWRSRSARRRAPRTAPTPASSRSTTA